MLEDEEFMKKYSKYSVVVNPNDDMDSLCKKTGAFSVKKQQEFVSEITSPNGEVDRLLVYHGIGSGKTCAAIRIAEKWRCRVHSTTQPIGRILVILPASLETNFRNELRTMCTNDYDNFEKYQDMTTRVDIGKNPYILPSELEKLASLNVDIEEERNRFNNIIKKSDKKIDMIYEIISLNKFALHPDRYNTKGRVVIIDEIQNMVSINKKNIIYPTLIRKITEYPPLKLILLSATPIMDDPEEFFLTINLLKPQDERFVPLLSNNDIFVREDGKLSIKNEDDLLNSIQGLISYYKGADSRSYPKRINNYIKCQMSNFQRAEYWRRFKIDETYIIPADVRKKPNAFMLEERLGSFIIFPNKKIGKDGDEYIKNDVMKKELFDGIEKYSCKLYKMLDIVENSPGPCFIYCNYVSNSGVALVSDLLKYRGIKHGIFSGQITKEQRAEYINLYNSTDNINGSLLKVIIGSPAMKEGVSLKNTRNVILMDLMWNESIMEQVIGRAIRYCSHINIKDKTQRDVTVNYLIAHDANAPVDPTTRNVSKTADEKMLEIIKDKKEAIDLLYNVIQRSAIDCRLFSSINNIPSQTCHVYNHNFIPDKYQVPLPVTKSSVSQVRFSSKENKYQSFSSRNPDILKDFLKYKLEVDKRIAVNIYNSRAEQNLKNIKDITDERFEKVKNSIIEIIPNIYTIGGKIDVKNHGIKEDLIYWNVKKDDKLEPHSIKVRYITDIFKDFAKITGEPNIPKKKKKVKKTVKKKGGTGDRRVKVPNELKKCPKPRRPELDSSGNYTCDNNLTHKYIKISEDDLGNKRICCYKNPKS